MGIAFTLVVASISIALTLFYIHYNQPDFVCELCKNSMNCTLTDLLKQYP